MTSHWMRTARKRESVRVALKQIGHHGTVYRSVPPLLGRRDDIGRHILNVSLRQAAAKGWHGILAVGHLLHHCCLVSPAIEVLLQRRLLEGLLRHDDVLATCMTRGTVAREDLLTGSCIAGEGGLGRRCQHASGKHWGDGLSNVGMPCCLGLFLTCNVVESR